MNSKFLVQLLSAFTLAMFAMTSTLVQAENSSDLIFTLSDFRLNSAGELVDICTVIPDDEHYEVAISFCYGFFEGAVRYDEVISQLGGYKDLVCPPPEVTRQQAVSVFTNFMKANPQYGSNQPVDAIFRSLVNTWPCES